MLLALILRESSHPLQARERSQDVQFTKLQNLDCIVTFEKSDTDTANL